jgi:hypothetical protein
MLVNVLHGPLASELLHDGRLSTWPAWVARAGSAVATNAKINAGTLSHPPSHLRLT